MFTPPTVTQLRSLADCNCSFYYKLWGTNLTLSLQLHAFANHADSGERARDELSLLKSALFAN